MTESPSSNVRFSNLDHIDGRHNPRLGPQSNQDLPKGECIDNSSQHTHVVRRDSSNTVG